MFTYDSSLDEMLVSHDYNSCIGTVPFFLNYTVIVYRQRNCLCKNTHNTNPNGFTNIKINSHQIHSTDDRYDKINPTLKEPTVIYSNYSDNYSAVKLVAFMGFHNFEILIFSIVAHLNFMQNIQLCVNNNSPHFLVSCSYLN